MAHVNGGQIVEVASCGLASKKVPEEQGRAILNGKGLRTAPPPCVYSTKPLHTRSLLSPLFNNFEHRISTFTMDTFTILYFASANTFTKRKDEKLPAPLVLSKLFETLEEKYPGIETKVLSSSALTINLEYVDLDDNADLIIAPGDEVAIIPPVSSG